MFTFIIVDNDLHNNLNYDYMVDMATDMLQWEANFFMKGDISKGSFYLNLLSPYMEVFNFLMDNNKMELPPLRKNYKSES